MSIQRLFLVPFLATLCVVWGTYARADTKRWIRQLGSGKFSERIEAERRLREAGPDAVLLLRQEFDSENLELRLRAIQLTKQLYLAGLQENRDRIFQNPWIVPRELCPDWERFHELAGDGESSRRLFAGMLASEPHLMMALLGNSDYWLSALERRCRDAERFRRSTSLNPESVAVLLFLAMHPDARPSPRSISTINMLVDDSRFLHAVERDSTGPALLAMLRQWIRTSRHASPYHLMNLAARFQVDDAIPAAREILDIRQLETTSPHLVMTSIMYLSRFGGMETIEDLLELLDDKRSLGRPRRSTSQRENAELQIRDVALLGLLQLTNQSPADYGFENVISSQLLGYSPNSASFANDDARDAAIEKWNRWKRLHLGNIATPIDASEWYPG